MIFPYIFNSNDRCVRVTLSGNVTGGDIAETIRSVYSDPLWHSGFDIVWNGAAATSFSVADEDESSFIALQYRFTEARGGRDILVMPRTTDFNAARRYALRSEGSPREVHVVRVEGEANHIMGFHLRPDINSN